MRAATERGEWDPGDGDVSVCDDDVIGRAADDVIILWWRDVGGSGDGPERDPPNEQRAAADVIKPRLPPGDVR